MLSLGEKISIARKKMKLSQEELADIIGASRPSISQWENNKVRPDTDKLLTLSNTLNLSVAYLIGETDDSALPNRVATGKKPSMKSNVHFETEEIISIDQIVIPVLSPEQTACCGKGIPLSEITYENEERIPFLIKEVGALCEGRMPFAIIADGTSMERWGIKDGSRVVINPVEDVHDFDIALVCYKDSLGLKKLQRMQDGSINLMAADGTIITVPEEDADIPDLFAVWGKAMTYSYKESGKIKHGL